MSLTLSPKRYRFPVGIISQAVWLYHRFHHSLRDVSEQLAYRGVEVSYETIRAWGIKFAPHFKDVIKKRERKPSDKWHLDEMVIKIKGDSFILWRAVDAEGYELDIFLQKRRNKAAAIRFLSRLLGSYPTPRIIVTDKLRAISSLSSSCARRQSIVLIEVLITVPKMRISRHDGKKSV